MFDSIGIHSSVSARTRIRDPATKLRILRAIMDGNLAEGSVLVTIVPVSRDNNHDIAISKNYVTESSNPGPFFVTRPETVKRA